MKEDKYQDKISNMKFSRVFAWVGIVILAIIIIATAITGIIGSKYFWGCLFMCMAVPFLMYVFLWIGKVLHSVNDDAEGKNIAKKDEEKD